MEAPGRGVVGGQSDCAIDLAVLVAGQLPGPEQITILVFDAPNQARVRYAIVWPECKKPKFYAWQPDVKNLGLNYAPTRQVREWLEFCLFENDYAGGPVSFSLTVTL